MATAAGLCILHGTTISQSSLSLQFDLYLSGDDIILIWMITSSSQSMLAYLLMRAAFFVGYEWSRSPSTHSPDISSPHYPDRPIRPLPRRRLRSRLSPDQADAIIYPLVPPNTSSAFYSPGANLDKVVSATRTRYDNPPSCNCGGDHSELESEDDDGERVDRRQPLQSQQRHNRGAVLASAYERWGSPFSKGQQPDSASSSADGYESFENTNNKKKRKIPLSGLTTSHVALAADMANMGINSPSGESMPNGGGLVGQYYGTGTSAIPAASTGTGISGAGRGRFGRAALRSSIDRKPLGASTSGLNAHSLGSTGRIRREWNGGLHEGTAITFRVVFIGLILAMLKLIIRCRTR